jgi:hypothetical protein
MPQDRESGAEANRFGRENGTRIMSSLGAERVKAGSNECIFGGQRVSVHCARRATNSVGVTKLCLERLDAVLGAFQQDDGSFVVIQLSADEYKKYSRPTRSRGPSAGRVLLVARSVFEKSGRVVGMVPGLD